MIWKEQEEFYYLSDIQSLLLVAFLSNRIHVQITNTDTSFNPKSSKIGISELFRATL